MVPMVPIIESATAIRIIVKYVEAIDNTIDAIFLVLELLESRRRELQVKRLQREKEQQDNIRQRQTEEMERRAQYAAEMEMKRERSEAILRDRETTIQKVRVTRLFS